MQAAEPKLGRTVAGQPLVAEEVTPVVVQDVQHPHSGISHVQRRNAPALEVVPGSAKGWLTVVAIGTEPGFSTARLHGAAAG